MNTLAIKDLDLTSELGRSDMAAVRGGQGMRSISSLFPDCGWNPPGDSSVHATQGLQQFQSVVNATANGSAYLSGVDVTNTTNQFGQNNIVVA
jgi:hypothetical protein